MAVRSRRVIRDYLAREDAGFGMFNENANGGWTPNGLLLTVAQEEVKADYLARIEEAGFREVAEWHRLGKVHLHDLGMGHPTGYCVGHSLRDLCERGLISDTVTAGPAKHLRTLCNHIIGFIGSCSNEWAGAQALSDIDVFMAPYLFADYKKFLKRAKSAKDAFEQTVEEAQQCVQGICFQLNLSTRYGSQAPFSNITLAMTCPNDLAKQPVMVAGEALTDMEGHPMTYGDLSVWQNMVAEAFLDVMLHGDHTGRVFTFPVLTANCTEELFDHPLFDKLCDLTAKYGTPFFQNFISGISGGKRLDPADVRSMCCRLSIDESMIRKHTGGLFGNGDNTGSLMVSTLNLPYLALEAKENAIPGRNLESAFYLNVYDTMCSLRGMMSWKRGQVEASLKSGFLPMTKTALSRGFDTFYCTFGLIGLWEAVEIVTGDKNSLLSDEGLALGTRILRAMTDQVLKWSEEDKKLWNVEAVPGESAGYKLARKTLKVFPDAPVRGTKAAPYWTNGTTIPVEFQGDLVNVIKTQSALQKIPSGGTVVHLYTGEKLTRESVKAAIKLMCSTPIPFFSISAVYSHCPICGHKQGEHEFCVHTDEEIRAAGYDPEQLPEAESNG